MGASREGKEKEKEKEKERLKKRGRESVKKKEKEKEKKEEEEEEKMETAVLKVHRCPQVAFPSTVLEKNTTPIKGGLGKNTNPTGRRPSETNAASEPLGEPPEKTTKP